MMNTLEKKKRIEEETRSYHMSKLMYGTVGSFGFATDTDPGAENMVHAGGKVAK